MLEQVRNAHGSLAIEYGEERITYHDLLCKIRHFTELMHKRGVTKGARVLVMHQSCPDLFAALLALIGKGCTVIFAEEWTRINDLELCARQTECNFILTNTKGWFLSRFYQGLRTIRPIRLSALPATGGSAFTTEPLETGHPAIISFSSGTSGVPKSIIRTHQILEAQFNALKKHILQIPGRSMCTNFPVVILLNLGLGIPTYISASIKMSDLPKTKIPELYEELYRKNISQWAFSPYLLRQLATYITSQHKKVLAPKRIITGGSPLFPAYINTIRQAISYTDFIVLYGSSEAEPIAYCHAEDILKNNIGNVRGLYAGIIDQNTKCVIIDRRVDDLAICNPGQSGEIVVTGNHVVKSYLNSQQAYIKNKVRIKDEIWHCTGDYGFMTQDGKLILTGPSELIHNDLYLAETEMKLAEIRGVEYGTIFRGAAFIQLSGSKYMNEVKARIERDFGISTIKFIKMPLDRRHNGKIRYKALKA